MIPYGEKFKAWLKEHKMRQCDFVTLSGLSPTMVCRLGKMKPEEFDRLQWSTIQKARATMDAIEADEEERG